MSPALQAVRPQGVDQLVGAAGQLGRSVSVTPDGRRHDRRLIRALFGDVPESEAPVPRVLHRE